MDVFNGRVYEDDNQVVHEITSKVYDEEEYTEVIIETL